MSALSGRNPTQDLWRIAETGEVGELEQLLARGAEVNARNDTGVTALMVASYHGRLEMVRALTDHGADVNAMDDDGFTAATLASPFWSVSRLSADSRVARRRARRGFRPLGTIMRAPAMSSAIPDRQL